MMVRSGNSAVRLGTLMSAVLLLLGAAETGWPQSAPPTPGLREQGPQVAPPPPPSSPASGEDDRGLIHGLSNLFDKVPSFLPPIKSPSETLDDLSRLAKPSAMVSGRVACPVSSNGAPDCKPAADQLCQSKGYKEGKSLNTDSAEKCSAKVLIPGRQRKPDDCRTDTVVTSALCQN
ncbi:hypothetical protein ACFQZO_05520 [Bradyrhizobium sp. GCM10027634]|uniref:hypothetical protein n=1 Tax=unclassified Bradyrhizobium TaxID=2631580 RepID=UPI00188CBF04|nr:MULTISPECIES: hypothetical protein [unclassified Bradyrhizobium]MDN5000338.1 hypothetical protein [Bradyrhizobium sp. WYCCWR 12677]QOZ42900.1 hypothetical protein XH89_05005 [Bradyrhizobium sp. CCBAU 53340]